MTTPEQYRQQRAEKHAAEYHAGIARLKAIRDEATAEHCPHGVPRANCIDHKPAKTEGA